MANEPNAARPEEQPEAMSESSQAASHAPEEHPGQSEASESRASAQPGASTQTGTGAQAGAGTQPGAGVRGGASTQPSAIAEPGAGAQPSAPVTPPPSQAEMPKPSATEKPVPSGRVKRYSAYVVTVDNWTGLPTKIEHLTEENTRRELSPQEYAQVLAFAAAGPGSLAMSAAPGYTVYSAVTQAYLQGIIDYLTSLTPSR